MSIFLIFIPALVTLFALIRWGTQRTFLNVYLPVMMILPQYFYIRFPHLPIINFAIASALPLGIWMFFSDLPRWKFSRTDVWLGLYLTTTAYADVRYGRAADGFLSLFDDFCIALVPYMAAKLLIEPGARVATVKRLVWCLFLTVIPSMYEFFSGNNLFRMSLSRFFPEEKELPITQMRWGFGRLAGPYPEAELAGMILFTGIVLAIWLGYWHYWEPKFKALPVLPIKKAYIIVAVLVAGLAMTESRGPWIGLFLAGSIAYVGRARKIGPKAMLVGGLLVMVGIPGYIAGEQYLSGPATTSEQEAAQYRKSMLTNYMPIAEFGGAFGWGENFPKIYTQGSIDNEYLLVDLTRGYLGLAAFVMFSLEAWYALAQVGLGTRSLRERHFSFTLLGILTGLLLTIGTVYLGSQSYSLYFLLVGWSQALRLGGRAELVGYSAPVREVEASHSLVRVYT